MVPHQFENMILTCVWTCCALNQTRARPGTHCPQTCSGQPGPLCSAQWLSHVMGVGAGQRGIHKAAGGRQQLPAAPCAKLGSCLQEGRRGRQTKFKCRICCCLLCDLGLVSHHLCFKFFKFFIGLLLGLNSERVLVV